MRAFGLAIMAMLVGACASPAQDEAQGGDSAISGGKTSSAQTGVGIVHFYNWGHADLEAKGLTSGPACTGTLVTTDKSPAVTHAVLTAAACVSPLLRALGDLNEKDDGYTWVATFEHDDGQGGRDETGVQLIHVHGAFALLVLEKSALPAKPVQLWPDDDTPAWVRYYGYGCSAVTNQGSRWTKHQLDADWDDSTNGPKGGSVWCDKGDLGGAVFNRPYVVGTGPLFAIMTGPNSYATIPSDRNWIRASVDGLRR